METQSFENVKSQIGRCGIWCGSCVVGNGTLRTLGRRCEHIIRGYGVDDWGATDFDGKEFMKGLAGIQAIPVCRGCLKGGGNEVCRIRPCASSKQVSDCVECGEMATCEHREALQKVRAGAARVGMQVIGENDGTSRQELMQNWTTDISGRCPHCGA